MNKQEKKELTLQFVEFIQAVKKLIFLIKKRPGQYEDLQDLASIVGSTMEKYYLNLDLCDACGHPIPTLPSRTRFLELEEKFLKYVKTFESLTGEEIDSLWDGPEAFDETEGESPDPNFQLLNLDQMKQEAEEHKRTLQKPLTAAPRLQKIAEKDKKPVIEAQLISVS